MNSTRLPAGYRLAEVMDFVRNRKQLKTVSVLSLGTMAVMVVAGVFLHPFGEFWRFARQNLWVFAVFAAAQVLYVPLHELVHGLPMWLLTGVKPRYGVKLCYAYAGSTAYFDKRSHAFVALLPLCFFGILLAVCGRVLPEAWHWVVYSVQIANVAGSMGDVYCVLHLRTRPPQTLVHDNGTSMRVYVPKEKP